MGAILDTYTTPCCHGPLLLLLLVHAPDLLQVQQPLLAPAGLATGYLRIIVSVR